MKVWMYYETDGDAGYYHIHLFKHEELAINYRNKRANGYGANGHVTDIMVLDDQPLAANTQPIVDVLCPDCGEKMISRTGKYGTFWGCTKYPKCKGTRDSEGRSREERNREREKADESEMQKENNDKYRFRKDIS